MSATETDNVEPDRAAVRAWTVKKGLVTEDDGSPVTPPEIRAYLSGMKHERRLKEIAVLVAYRTHDDGARAEERSRRAWVASEAFRTRAAREWGTRQGLKVGKRGRVPAAVMAAFLGAAEKGELRPSAPEFKVRDIVAHTEFPERVGHVIRIEYQEWAPELIYTVRWSSEGSPSVPYRSGLRLVGNQLGAEGAV
ncbi:Lsr2 family DNA-binding protein [Streptomyces bluensis]|uniref:Lsr2 family DNA-binding protein n=1 Tax=Streptomyces bluensis TaxID=33897 RepID=UPI00331BC1AB